MGLIRSIIVLVSAIPLVTASARYEATQRPMYEDDILRNASRVNVSLYVMSRCPDAVRHILSCSTPRSDSAPP